MSSSSSHEAYEMHRQRVIIASHPEERVAQTARFILSCVSLASDLQEFVNMRRERVKLSPEAISAERSIEDQIRCEFRKRFGCEMGLPIPEVTP